MKEFFDGSSPKDIFQAKLNSMMEKSNSDNPMEMKRNTQKNLQLREEMKNTICKRKPTKKKRKKYIMDYEYALLEKQRNTHTICSGGRFRNMDTDTQMAKRDQAMNLLLFFQQLGVSASGSKPFLCQLSVEQGD